MYEDGAKDLPDLKQEDRRKRKCASDGGFLQAVVNGAGI